MIHAALIPWLDPNHLIGPHMGAWAIVIVCAIIFAETGLLVGFIFPGDTLLFFSGLLTFTGVIVFPVWVVALAVAIAAFLGGELGYYIGRKVGPRIFERRESGLFSTKNVERTNVFFDRFGGRAVILARFVPVVRTFAPVAAGVGRMDYRRYSIYNLIGAVIWGAGMVLAGYFLAHVPFIRHFAIHYIDLVLIAVVIITIVPTAFHYLRGVAHARRENRNGSGQAGGAAGNAGAGSAHPHIETTSADAHIETTPADAHIETTAPDPRTETTTADPRADGTPD